jgi:putative ABC transport system ATP-binding protein
MSTAVASRQDAFEAAMGSAPILVELRNIEKVYTKAGTDIEVHALRGFSLSFKRGEYAAICGHSGSGKSTLMNVLGCLDRPTGGEYLLGGQDVSKLDDNMLSEVRGMRLGFVFQNFNLIQQLTVLENLEVPLFYQGVHPKVRRERAMVLLERVGLVERMHHRPMELSGGQQQRVAIARSLVNDPYLILADEPTGNLDTATGDVILALFEQLHEEGKTILMVTHEPDVAARCRRVVTLRDGLVITDTLNARK